MPLSPSRWWQLLAALVLCVTGSTMARAEEAPPPLIVVSLDGFRADYLTRGASPTLAALAASGVRAERMIPSFPSITFPNHTTLVTGKWPDHHGIIANTFRDPAVPGVFTMQAKDPQWWTQALPLWASAERAGIHTGVMFWPGSDVPRGGTLPGLYRPFDHSVAPAERVATVLGWLDLPAAQRPRLILLYFEHVDSAGHAYGPDAPQVTATIAQIDQALAQLTAGLAARNLAANLVVLADHGMAPVGANQTLVLDDMVDLTAAPTVFTGALAGFAPAATPAGEAATRALFAPHAHWTCWRKADLPARFHYGTSPRVPPVVCLAETGWLLTTRTDLARAATSGHGPEHGSHGYDPQDPTMAALFVANGPAFARGLTVPPFDNVDVYPLLARVLGIKGEPGDGDLRNVAGMLADGGR